MCDSLSGDRPAPPAHAHVLQLQSALGAAGAPGYSALHAGGDANGESERERERDKDRGERE